MTLSSRNLLLGLACVGLLTMTSCSHGPELTAQQKQGKKIYESLCNKCHKLIDPTAHSEVEWNAAVDRFGAQLQLTYEEKSAVKAYLAVASKQKR